MGGTWIRRWLPVVIVGVLASVGVAACGDDDDGDDIEAYCALSEELDSQEENLPTDEQLDEINELAPDEIADEVEAVVALLKEYEGETDFEIQELFVPIDFFEAENCDFAEGS